VDAATNIRQNEITVQAYLAEAGSCVVYEDRKEGLDDGGSCRLERISVFKAPSRGRSDIGTRRS
jgi:hypothetical protein